MESDIKIAHVYSVSVSKYIIIGSHNCIYRARHGGAAGVTAVHESVHS